MSARLIIDRITVSCSIGVIGRALWIKRRRLTESALGYRLVVADYSQIELRAAAERSGDRRMIEAYQNDEDLHRLTAALIADKSLDQVEKSERQAAKAINFGLIYAMGAKAEYAYNNFHCRSCGSNLSR
ncbi:MAG: hypothetical protein HC936_18525 [Leptolyngbyaceae cyanobacterium SU_3_3]|nr:hypothetical protein [Leptolyngbyaceae cyanobacterium SU_3_3]